MLVEVVEKAAVVDHAENDAYATTTLPAISMTDDPADAQLAVGSSCSTNAGVTGVPVVSAAAIFTNRGGSTCSATESFCSRVECTACSLLCSVSKPAACIHRTQARSKLCGVVICSAKK